MAVHPTLKRAVAKTKSKASDYNDNFDMLMEFVDDSIAESKTYVDGFMPSVTGKAGKFLTNNGTTANWADLPSDLGVVKWYAGEEAPAGYLLCDGSAISRTTYSSLFLVIGTTYGEGDGSTTFNLPDLVDKFIEGAETAGTEKSAGLPNITGRVACIATYATPTGAFYFSGGTGAYGGGSLGSNTVSMDASRQNAIFGASDTVQPPALTMLPIIKY